MYKIKDGVDLECLREYEFRLGNEYPEYERFIYNESEQKDYWLVSVDPDKPSKVHYASDDVDEPIWSIHVNSDRRLYIDCVPGYTYHISNTDMEIMFYALYLMIKDGIIEDDFNS